MHWSLLLKRGNQPESIEKGDVSWQGPEVANQRFNLSYLLLELIQSLSLDY